MVGHQKFQVVDVEISLFMVTCEVLSLRRGFTPDAYVTLKDREGTVKTGSRV